MRQSKYTDPGRMTKKTAGGRKQPASVYCGPRLAYRPVQQGRHGMQGR